MSFPRYGSYKDSGVEWFGEVPSHWPVSDLKRLATLVYGDALPQEARDIEGDIPVYGSNGIVGFHDAANTDQPVLLIGRKGSCGALNWSAERAFAIDTVYYVDGRSSRVCLRWLFWALHIVALAGMSQDTGVPGLSRDQAYQRKLPFPLPSEQAAIAAFLDRETAKIDALVEEQRRLIALLAEKRQAVISHAVTKGLDPTVPMKDSGVEWLGEVPAHWDRVQLGKVCREISDGPHFSPTYTDDGVMFLSARNVRVDRWSLDDVKFISDDDYREFSRRILPELGDILYTKGGTTGIARVVDISFPFQVWVHIAVLKLNRGVADPYYIAYCLNSIGCYEQAQLLTRGATNNDLGLTRMVKIWLAIPSMLEQGAVVAHLRDETAKLDALTAEAQAAITLLQERRAALISAAVTGKIDVRGLVPAVEEAA